MLKSSTALACAADVTVRSASPARQETRVFTRILLYVNGQSNLVDKFPSNRCTGSKGTYSEKVLPRRAKETTDVGSDSTEPVPTEEASYRFRRSACLIAKPRDFGNRRTLL
jgi:hypothetical protein